MRGEATLRKEVTLSPRAMGWTRSGPNGEERKNFPCRRIITSASAEACGGSDNDEDPAGQLGSKRWVSVMADASAKGQAEDGGFLWRAMGISDLRVG